MKQKVILRIKCLNEKRCVLMCVSSPGIVYNLNGEYYNMGCHKLDCPDCGWRIKKHILDDIALNFNGEEVRHAVFTLRYSGSRFEDNDINMLATKFLHRVFNNINVSWKRGTYVNYSPNDKNGLYDGIIVYGDKIKYFYTPELTDNGMIHFHVIWNLYIKKSIVEDMWWKATNKTSYIVRLKYHGLHSPAGYISKYLTKSFGQKFDKRIRRYCFSRSMKRTKFVSDKKFYFKSNKSSDFNIVIESLKSIDRIINE